MTPICRRLVGLLVAVILALAGLALPAEAAAPYATPTGLKVTASTASTATTVTVSWKSVNRARATASSTGRARARRCWSR